MNFPAILLLLPLVIVAGAKSAAAPVVAELDGHGVIIPEYKFFIARMKAGYATRWFSSQKALPPECWDKPLADAGGMSAAEALKQAALDEALAAKARLVLYYEYNLIADPGWDAFQKELTAENERRARAAALGRPIYGPVRFTPLSYWLHRETQLSPRLAHRLRAGESGPGEDWEREFYEKNKERIFNSREGILPIERARSIIRSRYFEERVRQLARARLESAKIKINRQVVASIPIE
ncbi:MAG: hypothetical protein LBC18_12795 [Opitutaceae bacterium]|jgi:hypothetical protein|nr:hypothetical protein [Opitutaceae bacterium]